MTATRQHQSCSIRPAGDGYTATFGLCDHTIGPDAFETVDQAATAHMFTCPPRVPDDAHLYDADPICDHEIVGGDNHSGVKCVKCPGWFCY